MPLSVGGWGKSAVVPDSGMLRPRISEGFARDEQNLRRLVRREMPGFVATTVNEVTRAIS